MANEGRFQVAVGAVIQNSDNGLVLLIHRNANQFSGNIWEFPIGRINQFESFEDGLRREVQEETGITDLEIGRPFSYFEFMRGDHNAENEVRAVVFVAKTKQSDVKLSDEHDGYKWVTIDEAIELAEHPGTRRDLNIFRKINDLKP